MTNPNEIPATISIHGDRFVMKYKNGLSGAEAKVLGLIYCKESMTETIWLDRRIHDKDDFSVDGYSISGVISSILTRNGHPRFANLPDCGQKSE